MRFYSTQYRLPDPTNPDNRIMYHSSIYAATYGYACKLAVMRNIGEFVVGVTESADFNLCPLPSSLYDSRKMMDCLHTLTFYSWIGTKSGAIDPSDMLNDTGLIHEIMHEIHHPTFYGHRQHIQARLQHIETLIPGLKSFILPPDFELDDAPKVNKKLKISIK